MAINASVEIFVIKTQSVLNLLPIWSRNVGNGPNDLVFFQMRKIFRAWVARIGAILNC